LLDKLSAKHANKKQNSNNETTMGSGTRKTATADEDRLSDPALKAAKWGTMALPRAFYFLQIIYCTGSIKKARSDCHPTAGNADRGTSPFGVLLDRQHTS